LVVGLVAIAAVVVGSSCKKKAGSDGDSPQAKPPPAPVPDRGSDDGDDILAFDSLGFTATRTTTCPDLIGKPANGGPPTPLSTALAGARSISLPDLDRHDRALLLVPDASGTWILRACFRGGQVDGDQSVTSKFWLVAWSPAEHDHAVTIAGARDGEPAVTDRLTLTGRRKVHRGYEP
jgi:hypothetical protein